MFGRRSFLEALASTPVLSALLPATALAAGKRDIIRELGVRTFIDRKSVV